MNLPVNSKRRSIKQRTGQKTGRLKGRQWPLPGDFNEVCFNYDDWDDLLIKIGMATCFERETFSSQAKIMC